LKGKVLDVGCDKAVLKGLVNDIKYTGIDIGGTPDIDIDLDEIGKLPFEDNSFDCVVCSDVLEHLENLHYILTELVRVASNNIVISLPNNWTNARRSIEKGKGSIAHYGLPLEKPGDRHRWFFSMNEAISFLEGQAERMTLKISEIVINEKPRNPVIRGIRHLRHPIAMSYLNRYAHTVWFVYSKN